MKEELQAAAVGGVPSTVVNQNGEKNVHADHVDTVNQYITINCPYAAGGTAGRKQTTTRKIDRNHYNLFVMGGEPFEHDHFIVPADRALTPHWTAEALREELGELTEDAIGKIKTFPALFMQEAEGYYAKASEEQQVIFGFVDGVRVQDNGIRILCQVLWPIPMRQIRDIGFELGMKDMTRAITEMNHTHWAIKRIDLIEELKDAGIGPFGL